MVCFNRSITCSYTKGKINTHTKCLIGMKLHFNYNVYNIFRLQCSLHPIELASVYVCSVSLLIKFCVWYVVQIMTWLIWDYNTDFCNPPSKTSRLCHSPIKVSLRLLSWIYWALDTLCVAFQYLSLPRLPGLNDSNWNGSIQVSLFLESVGP